MSEIKSLQTISDKVYEETPNLYSFAYAKKLREWKEYRLIMRELYGVNVEQKFLDGIAKTDLGAIALLCHMQAIVDIYREASI